MLLLKDLLHLLMLLFGATIRMESLSYPNTIMLINRIIIIIFLILWIYT
jgi:hypothetical protein